MIRCDLFHTKLPCRSWNHRGRTPRDHVIRNHRLLRWCESIIEAFYTSWIIVCMFSTQDLWKLQKKEGRQFFNMLKSIFLLHRLCVCFHRFALMMSGYVDLFPYFLWEVEKGMEPLRPRWQPSSVGIRLRGSMPWLAEIAQENHKSMDWNSVTIKINGFIP